MVLHSSANPPTKPTDFYVFMFCDGYTDTSVETFFLTARIIKSY